MQNDKDFAKAREELKECMKDYRTFLLKALGKFVFFVGGKDGEEMDSGR